MKWEGCPQRPICIELINNGINNMNWKNCSKSLITIDLTSNVIKEMKWRNCPQSLTNIILRCNKFTEMNWKECPQSLIHIDLGHNYIKEMNWKECPRGLSYIDLYGNSTNMNWKYIPWNLEFGDYNNRILNDEFIKYKNSRDNIPDLPYISDERKEFISELIDVLHLPPRCNGEIESSYYKYPLYKNGGIAYIESMNALMK
jgi:hypothetical protein